MPSIIVDTLNGSMELLLAASLFGAVLFVIAFVGSYDKSQKYNMLVKYTLCIFLSSIMAFFSQFITRDGNGIDASFKMFAKTMEFFFCFVGAYYYSNYLMSYLYKKGSNPAMEVVDRLIMIVYPMLLIFNTQIGFIIGYGSDGNMFRGPMYLTVGYLFPIYYLCLPLIHYVKNFGTLEHRGKLALGIVSALFIMGIGIQVLSAGTVMTALLFGVAGGMVMYFSLETSDYRNLIETNEKLVLAEQEAMRANKAKSEFLTNISHEIRTPINAILGMDEMILRESSENSITRYAMDIQTSGQTLLGLINDLLDFSRIESGKMELIPGEYELSSVLNDLVNMISVRAKEKELEFTVEVDESIPYKLYGDSVRIKQCILNLLTNGVKYTHEGGVVLRVHYNRILDGNIRMRIEVQDTGIGIKREDMHKLMSPFERIEENRNRSIEGTGLGMSIVNSLLAMMNTRLEVYSTYGSGSTFAFDVEQNVVEWEPLGDFKEVYERSVREAKKYRESFQAPDARILVVDDTKMNLTIVVSLLKKVRIQIDTAESGREALELASRVRYDCIFLDQRMPEMDGVETLHRMKAMEGGINSGVPCIALTANAVSGAREMFLAEGFDDYMSKPVEGKKLEKMLIEYLPDEKIYLQGDEGYVSDESEVTGKTEATGKAEITEGSERTEGTERAEGSVNGGAKGSGTKAYEEGSFMYSFSQIGQVDVEKALLYCMDEAILQSAVSDYAAASDDTYSFIERCLYEGDIRNYTIKVHALKSSSRMIGASELSELAAHLESCGDAGDLDSITAETPLLLEMYGKLSSELKGALYGDESAGQADSGSELEEIPREVLAELYAGLREFVEAFDFDGAEDIISAAEEYRLPDDEAERFEKVKKMLRGLERDALLELLADNMEGSV